MGWKCAVCTNTSRNTINLSFFRIPKNKLRKKWLKALKMKEEMVNKSTRICSEHFFAGEKKLSDNIPDLSIGKALGKKSKRISSRKIKVSKKSSSTDIIHLSDVPVPTEPSGDACQPSTTETNDVEKLKRKILQLEKEIDQTKHINAILSKENSSIEAKLLRYENIQENESKVKELTGLPDSKTFEVLFELFDKPKQYCSYSKKYISENFGRHRVLSAKNEFFMYLLKLRQDLSETVLSSIFNVSVSTVSCILSTWACHVNSIFSLIDVNPSVQEMETLCPKDLKQKFPNCVMILDCTEFEVDEPSELDKQSVFWSEYWSRHTAKALVGCTLWGSVSFVSNLFPGSTTDVEMCKKSGLLNNIKPGEVYMADKGFTAQRQFQEKGAKLIIPPFANKNKKQFNPQQVEKTKHIASTRIFVEQAIGRIKSYKYLTRRIPISNFQLATFHFKNIAYLTNFQRPFVTVADPILTARRKEQIEVFCNRLLNESTHNEEFSQETDNDSFTVPFVDPVTVQNNVDHDIDFSDVSTYDDDLVRGLVDLLVNGDVEMQQVFSVM